MVGTPDTPCSGCGKMLWRGNRSLPGGTRLCVDCRRAGRPNDHVLFTTTGRHLALVRDDGTVPAAPTPPPAPSAAAGSASRTSVLTAAESGSELEQMTAMSAVLARSIADPSTNSTALAALVRRQLDLFREIAVCAGTPIDRDRLVTLRARVARALDDPRTNPSALSALTHRQFDIARELAALDALTNTGDGAGATIATTDDELWDASTI